MSRRRSEVQRVTAFFLTAPVDEAKQALEIAKTILESRLPARSVARVSRTKRAAKVETEAA